MKRIIFSLIPLILTIFPIINGYPEQGKWETVLSKDKSSIRIPKSVYAGTKIYVQTICEPEDEKTPLDVKITWKMLLLKCWQEYVNYEGLFIGGYIERLEANNRSQWIPGKEMDEKCSAGGHIVHAEDNKPGPPAIASKMRRDLPTSNGLELLEIKSDGLYIFQYEIQAQKDFTANIVIEVRRNSGYLSAVDWPLLPFYGTMCLVYVFLGIIWLVVSFVQWRDLLRIQFWIGGVILLGMLEKAMFYGEYQSINSNGQSVQGMVLLAEWVSCAKRTLARMLVIIVSLGFGIVKPRLGPMLHRVVGTGALYLVLACVESYLRIMHNKNDPNNQILVASIPLAVLDSAICWWIFTSLVQTTRTLRLRRNMVKLSLYKHFTNTLIFAVLASVIFMLYSIKTRKFDPCFTEWKDLWIDEGFWHVLFSTLLLVIMILWRPTNNNQRYAFTPLLDNPEDEDEEEEHFVSDAYGVKMRGARSSSPKPNSKSATNEEDDLKWVEENIPAAAADMALPVLDSDEEIINTKFEVSKMQ